MNDDEEDTYLPEFDHDEERYRPASSITADELPSALRGLTLLGDDPYLSMQATNLGMVDVFCMQLEQQVLQQYGELDRTPPEAFFLQAQSQMWIFAAYELMRTWRERAKNVLKWADNSALDQMISNFRKDEGYRHYGRLYRADQLERVRQNPELLVRIRDDRKRTHMIFRRIEHVRVGLAKHEVAGANQRNSVSYSPGYGRIDMSSGAIDFEMSNDKYVIGTINRRDIADSLRLLPETEVPTDEAIASFDEFMDGKIEVPDF